MALKERWDEDVKQAMLARNEVVRDTLRLLLSEIKKANLHFHEIRLHNYQSGIRHMLIQPLRCNKDVAGLCLQSGGVRQHE